MCRIETVSDMAGGVAAAAAAAAAALHFNYNKSVIYIAFFMHGVESTKPPICTSE